MPDDPTHKSDSDFLRTLMSGDADAELFTPDTLRPDEVPPPAEGQRPAGFEVVPGYEVLSELGRGGMGIVYKARQVGLNRVVALKMILTGPHASPEERQRFRKEAEAIARLQHPNIVQVYEVSEHAGQPYFSLEFCPGGSLAERLDGTPLPPRLAARLVIPLARGAHHAHEHGIVHRDLKPGNILLGAGGGDDTLTTRDRPEPTVSSHAAFPLLSSACPKLTDFGLAKRLDADSRTRDGDVMGTPSYMAPEQAAGKVTQIGPYSDTYALGAILYELLTGRPPFVASSPMETVFQVITRDPIPVRALQPKTPRDLETIALKCLQKEPARRYASAAALADDLQRYLDGRPILARPVGLPERAWRWAGRHPAQAALAAVVLVAAVGLIGGWAWFTRQLSLEKQVANQKADEAEEARGVADAQRRRAEEKEKLATHNEKLAERRFLRALEVADSYFTEVSENTLLHEPGMELVRQSLLRKARDFYADFVHERRDDRRLDNELARSFYRLGLIDAELSQYKSAEGLLRDALGRFDRLLVGPSADGRLRETRARLLNDLGRVERLLDRHDQALAAYGRALEAWQQLARDTAGSRAAKEGLGRCLLGLGNVLRKLDRREEALKLYRRSLDYRRALVEADPNDENYRRDLALTWQSLAGVLSLMGRDREATEARRQSLATFRQLVQAHPTRCRYREDLAVEQYNEGYRLMHARSFDPAAGCYAEAIAHFEFLVSRHPAKRNYLSRLGDTLYNRAGCLHESAKLKPDDADYRKARLALADAEYAKARLVREQLAKEQPAVPLYQVAYAQCLRGDGDRAQEGGQKSAAAEAYRQARAVLEKAPPSPDGRYLLAVVLHKLALLAPAGEADHLFDLALAEARGLVRENLLVEKASRLEGYILQDRVKKARP